MCANGACYKNSQHCNGLPDCRDGSDEFNCSESTTHRIVQLARMRSFEQNENVLFPDAEGNNKHYESSVMNRFDSIYSKGTKSTLAIAVIGIY